MTSSASDNAKHQLFDRELSLTRIINASPDKVFRCWTEPALIKQWFAPLPYTTPFAETDVRPGGSSLIVMRGPDGIDLPNSGSPPSARQAFTRRCYLYGITSKETVEELWKQEQPRLKVAEAAAKEKSERTRKQRKQDGKRKRRG